ncbi:hypothetical protein V5O48_017494 [Marasmius crinis-equi]|uniref:Uncharacterized protein n=1 Tax=Marasmius crinis-equi TaxID=585013 RepID=A0ABR3ENV4_9AGAR
MLLLRLDLKTLLEIHEFGKIWVPKEAQKEAFVFKMFGQVSNKDCFAAADGGWSPTNNPYNKTFADGAELSISLAYPKLCTPLKREWPAAIKQLKGLIFGEVEPSLPLKGAWIPETDDSSGYGRIKLKHAFFQQRESGAHSVESPIPWDHWPVSNAAKPSFNRLRDADTHDLVQNYYNRANIAHFTLEVWRFGGRSQTFKARIVKLYIVTKPLMILIESPTKRPRVDSEDENSPLKKRRATSSSQGSGTSQKSVASSSQGSEET